MPCHGGVQLEPTKRYNSLILTILMASEPVGPLWFRHRALSVNMMTFNQARVNGEKNQIKPIGSQAAGLHSWANTPSPLARKGRLLAFVPTFSGLYIHMYRSPGIFHRFSQLPTFRAGAAWSRFTRSTVAERAEFGHRNVADLVMRQGNKDLSSEFWWILWISMDTRIC